MSLINCKLQCWMRSELNWDEIFIKSWTSGFHIFALICHDYPILSLKMLKTWHKVLKSRQMSVDIGVILSTKRQKRANYWSSWPLTFYQDSKGIYAELKRFIGNLYSRIETFLSLNAVDWFLSDFWCYPWSRNKITKSIPQWSGTLTLRIF